MRVFLPTFTIKTMYMKFVHCLFIGILLSSLTSCVDIFDEIVLHTDGSGTYKYTVNMSASKVKINSILALDSIDGRRVPKIPELKEKIALYMKKLEAKEGISNVKMESNFVDFIFKFSCDFTNVTALQNAIREIIKEEAKDKNDPLFSETWLTWDGKQLVRSVPNFQAPLAKLKPEDQEALKKGKYIAVSRFDKAIQKCDNPQAVISGSKTAVKMETSTHAVSANPGLLKNTITLVN
jgi:hypothetical protein